MSRRDRAPGRGSGAQGLESDARRARAEHPARGGVLWLLCGPVHRAGRDDDDGEVCEAGVRVAVVVVGGRARGCPSVEGAREMVVFCVLIEMNPCMWLRLLLLLICCLFGVWCVMLDVCGVVHAECAL